MTDNHAENFEALTEKLNALEICVAQNEAGMLTVFTESEPLFCYDAATIEEAERLVAGTLQSYASRFFGVHGAVVTTNRQEIAQPQVAVEHVTPVAKLEPTLAEAA